jgi:hypothetical protein
MGNYFMFEHGGGKVQNRGMKQETQLQNWDELMNTLRGHFKLGSVLGLDRKDLERFLLVAANAKNPAGPEESERFAVVIRLLLQGQTSKELHCQTMWMGSIAIAISIGSMIVAIMK